MIVVPVHMTKQVQPGVIAVLAQPRNSKLFTAGAYEVVEADYARDRIHLKPIQNIEGGVIVSLNLLMNSFHLYNNKEEYLEYEA